MAGYSQRQTLSQRQVQKLSQRQIQAVKMLAMTSRDLREEILRFAEENPALEIISDPFEKSKAKSRKEKNKSQSTLSSDEYQAFIESREGKGETLQQHLMSQLNMVRLSPDEYSLAQRLIYNLDKDGFYGTMLSPESLIDKTRPLQNQRMLEKCLLLIQNMDPVGVCCKSPEESLFIQAKAAENPPELALFILDGHLSLLNPPEPEKIRKKVEEFRKEYHQKSFATELPIDNLDITLELVSESLKFILQLNPRPAGEFVSDSSNFEFEKPDVALIVERVGGYLSEDDFAHGKVAFDTNSYLQVKYASGVLPEVRISTEIDFDKKIIDEAKAFLGNLEFRESTLVLQGCEIVRSQKDFFEKGPGHLNVLTRRQVAEALGIHESTVSRISAKNNSRFMQTEWGLFPMSYFFVSGVKTEDGSQKISAETIKAAITQLVEKAAESNKTLSDSELCKMLNSRGIKIARRTVAKYRLQAGIKNSYDRK